MASRTDFRERLTSGPPVLLDGATGTELERRGFILTAPMWSAAVIEEQPDLLAEIHRDYAHAGAEILTANTFRTHRRNLTAAELDDRADELTQTAVNIAREASRSCGHPIWIAGSQSPLEDCYSPDRTPIAPELRQGHQQMSQSLAQADVDLILVETQITIGEAVIATETAVGTGLPVIVSFVVNPDGKLLSGESLADAAQQVIPFDIAAISLNCLPVHLIPQSIEELKNVVGDLPIGVYANTGWMDQGGSWSDTEATDPRIYATHARTWIASGIRLVGGCCGTTPEHVQEVRDVITTA